MQKFSIEETASRTPEPATWSWTRAYLLNLPVPFFFACGALHGRGFVGLLLGLIVVYSAGWRLARASPSLIQTVSKGGYVVAATQFLPILQLTVGAQALILAGTFVNRLSQGPRSVDDLDLLFDNGPFEAFLATIATGIGLLIPAFVIGLLLDQLFPPRSKPKPLPNTREI